MSASALSDSTAVSCCEKMPAKRKILLPDDVIAAECLPADYCDTFSRRVKSSAKIVPSSILVRLFEPSAWMRFLVKVRSVLARSLGIESGISGGNFSSGKIIGQNDEWAALKKEDRHLTFFVVVRLEPLEAPCCYELSISTLVRYGNLSGRIYFFFIRPFHRVIVRRALKNICAGYASHN